MSALDRWGLTIYDVIASGDFVVIDTETTGLHNPQIVQVAIIGSQGEVLLDAMVNPGCAIPPEATAIHGITNEMTCRAGSYYTYEPILDHLLSGTNILCYNASFDCNALQGSALADGMKSKNWYALSPWHCVMTEFARIYGEWNEYHGNYRWQKLSTAARYYGIEQPTAHTALADAQTTLAVARAMLAGKE